MWARYGRSLPFFLLHRRCLGARDVFVGIIVLVLNCSRNICSSVDTCM